MCQALSSCKAKSANMKTMTMTGITSDTHTLLPSDTAVMLRAQLGDLRGWPSFLSDNIRGRQDICGIRLRPCSRRKIGRGWRPIYAVMDIKTFITDVLAAVPSAGKAPFKATILPIDRGRRWQLNRFDKDGKPVPLSRATPGLRTGI